MSICYFYFLFIFFLQRSFYKANNWKANDTQLQAQSHFLKNQSSIDPKHIVFTTCQTNVKNLAAIVRRFWRVFTHFADTWHYKVNTSLT